EESARGHALAKHVLGVARHGKIVVGAPDLIISEIKLDDGDGFELCRRVRSTPEWQDIPFMFLTGEVGIENKIRGLELGVDEYLTKPIYIKEIVTRIHMLLQKRQRARIEERKDQRTRFVGRIADMPVVDVIQTIEVSRKSGVIHFIGERNHQAAIYFRDGKVIDAEAGPLTAEDAVYRLLTWSEGDFEVVFRTVRRREVIQIGSQALLMEGMRRLDEWTRLLEQLPPLSTHMDLKLDQLAKKLGEIPDESNRLLRLIDGKRSLMAVIDACDLGDLEALQAIAQLHGQGLLVEVEASAAEEDEGRPRLSLESVVARARGEESGPFSVPSTTPPSMPAVSSTLSAVAELAAGTTSGGFRPSGLRLVDEAVAAAQAIDPELAAWPDAGSVARTITGRARTISQITSFGLERAPDAPQLPQVKQRVAAQYEVQAPTRARTEPGLGSSPLAPAPAQEPARPAAQFAAAVPPEVPRRSRSITGQAMALSPRAAKTPPYGAPVSGAPRGQDDATPQVLVSEPSAKIVAEITAPRTAVRTFAALVEPSSAQAPSSSAQAPQAAATGPKARATTASDGVRATSEPGSARTDETVKERASSEQGTQPPRGEPESAFELANSDDDAALTRRRDAVLSVIQTKGTPLVARANTRPGSLPPGSGTSVALARKRRSSPPPPSRTVTPTGDGARPATLARITTEQRAVRVSEVAGPRRETRRMITSLGAATAEVSGEVEAPVIATEAQSETQRQMVTILPRRITREVPLVEAPVEVAPELSGPGRTNPRVEGKPREASAQAPGSESGPTQRRTTRELPAEPGIEVTSRAPRPTLVRRRVTEPEVLTPKSPAAVASRRITREVPAAAAIDAVEPALTAGEVAGEAVSDERRAHHRHHVHQVSA
ncbi:MAG TPA: DUF4388 domain-containing protein, partial [Kofleriaceae bacterium]|nr:DUF4388 domain-containing protein [Kofleriaceae bacterium]